MIRTKEEFVNAYSQRILDEYDVSVSSCSKTEKYEALVGLIRDLAGDLRRTSNEAGALGDKKVYYFSMEFLIGKLLENYLIDLGIRDQVEEGLADLGISFEEMCEMEPDPGLGNGGLGRLAACFLDSMAAVGVRGDGMGLRYHFGLFKQKIENGYQVELPDAWLDNGYPWEKPNPARAITVNFGGYIERHYSDGKLTFEHKDCSQVKAVPYEVPVVGYDGKDINTLYLWDAQPLHDEIDMDAFNRGDYAQSMKKKCEIEAITSILYPDDSNGMGKKLRLRQEYFLCAAGVGMIINEYKEKYGHDQWDKFADRVSIHTNDTHPTMCIPELMRVLVDEEGLEWDDAWDITVNTVSFTNHTVLPEALEKWPIPEFSKLLPRIYIIIEEINRRWQDALPKDLPNWQDIARETSALWDNEVKMANLSVIGSHSVNGVSALHSDIIKDTIFREFNGLEPEKFNNKTNGVSFRRFMIQANPSLAKLVTETIGDDWKRDMDKISQVEQYKDDPEFLERLAASKYENKVRLAKYVKEKQGIDIDPDSIFDVQVKRLHGYKRQLMNALKVLHTYNRLKENPYLPMNKYTFVFGAKAAQGYGFAKEVIKFINSVADLVNNDPQVNRKIKVVFIENFCVSNAQLIYPAADISEQISTAGKEASGTGNMKFMMNGAITLGTMDGANVEINQLVGDENMEIFGLSSDEAMDIYINGGYSAYDLSQADPRIKKMMEQLIDGTFASSGCDFWGIYDALLQHNDEFFVLKDFDAYYKAWENLDRLYNDRRKWNEISLI
ncbi:MAG: glycogen/starch/alpha-glucan phosphorylase, partial [Firmicutes bacterium]|nr:glycogen/starch/alpha-glucan phosphorylase [Bacillota bacterium]